MNVLGHHLYVRRLPAETTLADGALALPEAYQIPPTDYEVLAVGPGRLSESGVCVEQQAEVGDRVIVEAGQAFYKPYTEDDNEGFVADHDLVAVLPGPVHTVLWPANDYVLLSPDLPEPPREGIVRSVRSLLSGGDRMEQRGWDLLDDWHAYVEAYRVKWEQRHVPFPEEVALSIRFRKALTGDEDRALAAAALAARRGEERPRAKPRAYPYRAPVSGRVLEVGPGRPSASGPRLPVRVERGARVYFEREHRAVHLALDGVPMLLMREQFLCAAVEEVAVHA